MDTRSVLARNVKALMQRRDELKTPRKLAPRCSTATRNIGARTIAHLVDLKSSVQPQLDTIVAIAEAFKVPPWMLLTPDFDPEKLTGGAWPSERTMELARYMEAKNLTNDELNALIKVFGPAVPDEKVQHLRALPINVGKAGFAAPTATMLQEKPAPYKTPRQHKIKIKR